MSYSILRQGFSQIRVNVSHKIGIISSLFTLILSKDRKLGLLKERRVVASHFLSKGFGFAGADFIEAGPEAGTVVHLDEVGEFVLQDVILQVVGEEYKVEREVDVAFRAATAPTAFCR